MMARDVKSVAVKRTAVPSTILVLGSHDPKRFATDFFNSLLRTFCNGLAFNPASFGPKTSPLCGTFAAAFEGKSPPTPRLRTVGEFRTPF